MCLGCGLCEAVSGGKCSMELQKDGFYRPSGDTEGIDGIIAGICPATNIRGLSRGGHRSVWGNVVQVSEAWAADEGIRRSSSSGGVTSALAVYLLESGQVDGILHVGVEDGDWLHNRLSVSRTRDEVLRNSSSRYAPAAVFNRIKDILDADKGQAYAFIGKPCDIAGMQNFMREFPAYGDRIKYFLSIFCAGMPGYNATGRALATFGRKEEPTILRYRGDGWPGYFTATYSDGTSCRMTYNDSWGKILGRDLGFRCKICPDGIGLLADISSGDSWNTKDGYPDFAEAEGKNFCFIRNERGLELFRRAEKAGYIVAEALDAGRVRDMQRYQYVRRHLVGWRIAAVQCLTGGMLDFRGLGFYRTALEGNWAKGLKDALGTARRFMKLGR